MQKVILLGTDLHGPASEHAAKLVNDLANEFEKKGIFYKKVSIQNRKDWINENKTAIIPRISKIPAPRKVIQAILLPLYLFFLRLKYNKIFTFWTASGRYHSLLFYFLKKLGYEIYFTVISGYDKDYSALKNCDKIICQSEKMRAHLLKYFPKSKLKVIYPWVNLNVFKPAKKEYDILIPSVPYKIYGFKERGMDKIIEILKTGKFDAKVVFRSQESYDYFKALDLPNVELINKILGDTELSNLMSKARLIPLIYSKGSPDMPLSAIEGLACGCYLIITDEIGLGDIIEREKCGLTFKENSLANELERALSKRESGSNSFKVAKKYFDKNKNIVEYRRLAL